MGYVTTLPRGQEVPARRGLRGLGSWLTEVGDLAESYFGLHEAENKILIEFENALSDENWCAYFEPAPDSLTAEDVVDVIMDNVPKQEDRARLDQGYLRSEIQKRVQGRCGLYIYKTVAGQERAWADANRRAQAQEDAANRDAAAARTAEQRAAAARAKAEALAEKARLAEAERRRNEEMGLARLGGKTGSSSTMLLVVAAAAGAAWLILRK